MGQQPNVPLEIEHLPRRTPKPAAPRRWSPNRPGDLVDPGAVPWGGAFGTPGPDGGYALLLVGRRSLTPIQGESRADLEAAVAALMVARASRLGRAPIERDAEAAETILDVGGADPSWRLRWTAGLADKAWRATRLVDAIDAETLLSPVDELRARSESGERLLGDPT